MPPDLRSRVGYDSRYNPNLDCDCGSEDFSNVGISSSFLNSCHLSGLSCLLADSFRSANCRGPNIASGASVWENVCNITSGIFHYSSQSLCWRHIKPTQSISYGKPSLAC